MSKILFTKIFYQRFQKFNLFLGHITLIISFAKIPKFFRLKRKIKHFLDNFYIISYLINAFFNYYIISKYAASIIVFERFVILLLLFISYYFLISVMHKQTGNSFQQHLGFYFSLFSFNLHICVGNVNKKCL